MSPAAEEAAEAVAGGEKSLLRFITCGSVDDGKSTLIGRLLYDARALLTDQLSALEQASRRPGRRSEGLDFASLVDGLEAEQSRGITIDVAYRFFSTARRKFIIADTPGHEQFTRNMATGASTADAAVILMDASKEVLTQTRRHSFIVRLLGIRHIVLAVNKMDLVGWRQEAFEAVVDAYRGVAREAGIAEFQAIPVAALHGDNVVTRSDATAWYDGPCLLEHLEEVVVDRAAAEAVPFRMAVQRVTLLDDLSLCAGTVATGVVRRGDRLQLLPDGGGAMVERIVTLDGDIEEARAGQAIALAVRTGTRLVRGAMLCADVPPVSQQLDATIVWLASAPMAVGRRYDLKIGTRTVGAEVAHVVELVDANSGTRVAGRPLQTNDIGRCLIELDAPAVAVPYAENRSLGGFILIDCESNATVAAGMVGVV